MIYPQEEVHSHQEPSHLEQSYPITFWWARKFDVIQSFKSQAIKSHGINSQTIWREFHWHHLTMWEREFDVVIFIIRSDLMPLQVKNVEEPSHWLSQVWGSSHQKRFMLESSSFVRERVWCCDLYHSYQRQSVAIASQKYSRAKPSRVYALRGKPSKKISADIGLIFEQGSLISLVIIRIKTFVLESKKYLRAKPSDKITIGIILHSDYRR